ncbi:hypothetical protein [Pseudarthrobacter cellobiosi]|nr:hypothetical protein [Pseudarthrobacter sp. HLT1-5]MCO4253765.1 hypothetical protein [Pseudarthrobacter sp. HLT1-5]MCO4276482.1 hypothetical protein [Pseudarthrobacter sp. HLT3-5]
MYRALSGFQMLFAVPALLMMQSRNRYTQLAMAKEIGGVLSGAWPPSSPQACWPCSPTPGGRWPE